MPLPIKKDDMKNRREYYRHTFAADDGLPATVQDAAGGPLLPVVVLDLSLTGMRFRADGPHRPWAGDDLIAIRFTLPGAVQLSIEGRVIYEHPSDQGESYGVHFLPSPSAGQNAQREKILWRFLLQAQRRQLHGREPKAAT